MNFIKFGCCLLVWFVVVASCLLFVWVLSLGFDICGDPASDPQSPIEQQQQGKQFDHDNPINLKSIILLSTYMYTCIATLC